MARAGNAAPAASLAAFLAACTPMQQAAIDATLRQGEAGIKTAHDREALALKQAPCAMSVGGYVRVLTAAEREAVLALCGGEQDPTLADLAQLGRAIEMLQRVSRRDPDAVAGD